MKFHRVAVLLAVMTLTATGCRKSSQPAKNPPPAAPVGPVELKLKWLPGQRVVHDIDWKTKIDCFGTDLPAKLSQSINMTMDQKFALTTLKELPKGGHQVEVEFLSAHLTVETNGNKAADYDSEQKTDSNDPMADVFREIVGSKVDFYLNASNDLDRIDGMDDLKARMNRVKGLSAAMDDIFSKSYFKQMMSTSRFLPARAVAPGDSWPVQIEVPTDPLGTVDFNYRITLKSWETHGPRSCARLEFQGDIKSKPGQMVVVAGGSVSIQNGATAGVFWFDPELGMVIDTDLHQDLTTLISFDHVRRSGNARDAGTGTMTITNHMAQSMNLKLDLEKQ